MFTRLPALEPRKCVLDPLLELNLGVTYTAIGLLKKGPGDLAVTLMPFLKMPSKFSFSRNTVSPESVFLDLLEFLSRFNCPTV